MSQPVPTTTARRPGGQPERRRPGRPTDTQLTARLLTAGEALLARQGVARVNAEVVCADVSAGKAGFYRRWATFDDFLAAVLLTATAVPLVQPEPHTLRGDLTALLTHHVNHRPGTTAALLMSRLPHCPPLRAAWLGDTGPGAALTAHTSDLARRHGVSPFVLAAEAGDQIDALRVTRLANALAPIPDDVLALHVVELLEALDRP